MLASLSVRQWEALIRPKSIAVIGASSRPGPQNFAQRILNNNDRVGYRGDIFLVNPRHTSILERPCHPSVDALPAVPDVCLISTPAPQAIEAARASIAAGTRVFMVHSGDFADAGAAGMARQQELAFLCEAAGAALLGPNCLGMYHSRGPVALFGADIPRDLPKGGIAVVSASGSVAIELLRMGLTFGLHSAFSTGNEAVTTCEDILEHLVRDPEVSIIVVFVEALRKADAFRRIALEAHGAGKPVIVLKSGVSATGARVAQGHTGSLIGAAEAYEALLRQCGAVQVADFDELHAALRIFTALSGRRLRGTGPAMLGLSGGKLAVAADVAGRTGVTLPEFSAETRARLARTMALPEGIAPANPVDVGAGFRSGLSVDRLVEECATTIAADPAVGALLVPLATGNTRGSTSLDRLVSDTLIGLAGALPVPLFLAARGNLEEPSSFGGPPLAANLTLFGGLREAFGAMGAAWHWQSFCPTPSPLQPAARPGRRAETAARLKGLTGTLAADESEALCRDYAIPVIAGRILRQEDEVDALDLPFPVVAKVVSPDVVHKLDVGGVVLNIAGPAELRRAFRQIMADVGRNAPRARIDGILVAEQVTGGSELFMGSRHEPGLGSVVALGLGGSLVEILPPPQVLLAPFGEEDAVAALLRMPGHELVAGFRGRPAADLRGLARTAMAIAQLMDDLRGVVASIDLNPVVFNARHPGGIAVDARVLLAAGNPEIQCKRSPA